MTLITSAISLATIFFLKSFLQICTLKCIIYRPEFFCGKVMQKVDEVTHELSREIAGFLRLHITNSCTQNNYLPYHLIIIFHLINTRYIAMNKILIKISYYLIRTLWPAKGFISPPLCYLFSQL